MRKDSRCSPSLVGMLCILMSALLGCSQKPASPKAAYTVDEYLARPDLMEQKMRECASNPGDLRDNPDCVNVKAAAQQHSIGSRKGMEPLEFPNPSEANASAEKKTPR